MKALTSFYQTAAEWARDNQFIPVGWEAVESDTSRRKLGNGNTRYNDLPYLSNGIQLLSTTTVHTNVGTKQALYTVPAGKSCVVAGYVMRSASSSLIAYDSGETLTLGFDAGASDLGNTVMGTIINSFTSPSKMFFSPSNQAVGEMGAAADVLGAAFSDTSIDATVVIDVFGYLI